ncbi:MAG: PfkB family carbohydrate kinase [Haloarculaceae archaeon]
MDPNVLVAGETLIDFLPGSDDALSEVEQFSRRAGGAPANVAVRLDQLGHTPWFWTRVGDGPFGDFLVSVLDDRGLPDRFVERDPEKKTSLAFVSGDPESGPRFTFYRDRTADTRFQEGTVPDEVLDGVDWVVVGGVLLASSPSREAIHDLVERAGERGCTVVFDPNARPELWGGADFETEIRRILGSVDVVKATPGDLGIAGFDADADDLAEQVHEAGPHTVFLTMGEEGSTASSTADAPWGEDAVEHGSYRVDAVDDTGAGDAFTAGVVATLADGERDLERVLARANAVAAASTTRQGGMAQLPDPAEVVDGYE